MSRKESKSYVISFIDPRKLKKKRSTARAMNANSDIV